MIKYLLITCFTIFLSGQLLAQNVVISGEVKDERNDPLPGVNVIIDGSGSGTITDLDGKYQLEVPKGSKIIYSFIGYEPRTITVGNQSVIDVKLQPNLDQLDEVVVIGYGVQKRTNVVGAVADVSGQLLQETGVNNVAEALQGTLPGLFTEVNSGVPGGEDIKINIRGISTWADGGNEPLILVDGVEATGGFSQINAGEIESITVLKDASSTAVYGVRGANGVILVTTRRGQFGKPTISFSGGITAKSAVRPPEQLGSYDVLTLGQSAIKNAGNYASVRDDSFIEEFRNPNRNPYLYPDIDWYDELVRDVGWENNARINVSGGTDFVKYFTSLSYNHVGDIMKIDNVTDNYDPRFFFNKYGFRSNLDFSVTKSTKLKVDISGRSETQNAPNAAIARNSFDNVFKFINTSTPYLYPLYYPKEFLDEFPDERDPRPDDIRLSDGGLFLPSQPNAYNHLNNLGIKRFQRDVADITIVLDQDLGFLTKGLSFSSRVNYSTAFRYQRTMKVPQNFWYFNPETKEWEATDRDANYNTSALGFHPKGGELFNTSSRTFYYDARLLYNRTFDDHSVNFTGVFNRREKRSINDKKIEQFPVFQEDWVGRLVYNFKEKYFVEASAGYNGTDKFGPGYKFGFFPAGAVGWDIAKEGFVKTAVPWVNQFKIRYSYGITGSSGDPANDRGLYVEGYDEFDLEFGSAIFGLNGSGLSPRIGLAQIANTNASWETSIKQNLGWDVKLFDQNLSLTLDIFRERREDIFIRPVLASFYNPSFGSLGGAGKVTPPPFNGGSTKTQGVEFSTNYSWKLTNDLTLNLSANLGSAETRVVVREDRPFAPEYQKAAGKPLGWLQGFQTNGYLNNFEEAINSPEIQRGNQPGNYQYSDFNGNGQIDENDRIPFEGTAQPAISYGFNIGVNYKGLSVNARFYGKEGVVYSISGLYWYPNFTGDLLEAKTFHTDTWSPDNKDAKYPAFSNEAGAFYVKNSDRNIQSADFLKLQNLSVRYFMESDFIKRTLRISSMSFYLNGNNLFVWTKLPFGDPEGGNGVGGGDGGSFGNYPLVKRFTAGIDINF